MGRVVSAIKRAEHLKKVRDNEQIREDYKNKISEFRQAHADYVLNSNAFGDKPSEMIQKGQTLWLDFLDKKNQIIQSDREFLEGKHGSTIKKKYEEDIAAFENLYDVNKETFPLLLSDAGKISESNTRVNGLIEELENAETEANGTNEVYQRQTDAYIMDAKMFPNRDRLDDIDGSVKTMDKNMKLINHKLTDRTSKSNAVSLDIKNGFDLGKHQNERKKIVDAQKFNKKVAGKMDDYKKGNEKFDSVMGSSGASLDRAEEEYHKFNKKGAQINHKSFLTARKQDEYTKMHSEFDASQKNKSKIDAFMEEVNQGKYVISKSKRDEYRNYTKNSKKMKKRLEGRVEKRYQYLTENKDALSEKKNAPQVVDAWRGIRDNINTNMEKYKNESRKIYYEQQLDEQGGGLLKDIENDYETYKELTPIALANVRHKELAAKGSQEFMAKYEAFFSKRTKAQEGYQRLKPYLGTKPKRKMIMKLLRRIKMIEATGSAPKNRGFLDKVLRGIDTVEGIPEKLTDAAKESATKGMKGFDKRAIEAETDIEADMLQSAPTGIFDMASDAIEDAASFDEVSSGISKFKKTGESDQKSMGETFKSYVKKQDADDSTKGEFFDGYDKVMQWVGTIKQGYDLLKQVLVGIKDFKNGVDAREAGKNLMEIAEQCLGMFESITGFFDTAAPIFGLIKSTLTIVLKVIDWVRSQSSRNSAMDRMQKLKGTMKTRKDRAAGSSDEKEKASASMYDLEDEDVNQRALTTGFDTRGWGVVFRSRKHASEGARVYQLNQDEQAKLALKRQQSGEAVEGEHKNAITGTMYERMHELRKKKHTEEGLSDAEKEELKSLKQVSTTSEYLLLNEASVRMKNKRNDDIYDITTEGWSIISDFLKLTSNPYAAAVAFGGDIAAKVVDLTKSAGSYINGKVRDVSDNFYSSDKKKQRREEMAETMYTRLGVVAKEYLADNGEIDLAQMEDWQAREAGKHIESVDFNLTTAMDAYISHLVECTTKDEIIEQMGEAFSVEGN